MSAVATLAQPGFVVMDVYARRSFGKDGETVHEDEQAEECIDRIEQEPGWVLGKVFKDHALSAWDEDVVRPDFKELMTRVESGVSGGILVWDLARFTRQPMEGERLLAQAGRGIIVADLAMEYNVRSATGKKVFRDKVSAGAFESDTISERSTRGKRLKAKRGKSNATHRGFGLPGWLPNPAGWMPGDARVQVNEEQLAAEVAAIQDAARRVIAGESLTGIARSWNEAGLRTYTGAEWSNDSVRQTLRRPALAGMIEYKGKVVKETGEGPLDKATWQQMMDTFATRKSGRPASKYLLSGLVTCELCGSKLYGRPRYTKEMGQHRQYWCQLRFPAGTKSSGCGRLVIEQTFADDLVRRLVIKRLSDPRSAARLARVAAKVKEEHTRLRDELDTLQGKVSVIMAKEGSSPLWTLDRVEEMVAKYEDPIATLVGRIAELESGLDDGADVAVADAEAEWERGELEDRRRLIKRAFPEGITVRKATSRGVAALNEDRIVPTELVRS